MARNDARYTIRAEDKTGAGLRSAQTRLQRFGSAIASRVVIPIEALARTLTALPAQFTRTVRSLEETRNKARDLGVSIEEAAIFERVEQNVGASAGAITDAIETINERIQDARSGTEDASEAFAKLGLTFRDLEGLNAAQQLVAISDAFRQVADSEEAAGALSDLVGGGRGRLFGADLRQELADVLPQVRDGFREGAEAASEAAREWRLLFQEIDAFWARREGIFRAFANIARFLRQAVPTTENTTESGVFRPMGGVARVEKAINIQDVRIVEDRSMPRYSGGR